MSGDGRRWPYLATRHHITQWAERIDAPPNLPRLVRRLIDQTNDQVVELQMRADEGVRLRGYDGISRALRGTPFVPEGAAVWEMGTDQDPERKANDDYRKRTMDPLGIKREETTFVFVTPRSWPGKTEWAKAKQDEGIWADVVAYDADDIDQALERAPAAQIWFSELVGLPAHGAQSLTKWWARFSQLSSPPLTPAMVLAGRADQAAALLRILEGDAQVTTVSAASEDELLAFVASVVLSVPDDDRVRLLDARSIVVKDAFTLQRLEYTPDSLVLLPYYDELRRDARLIQSHHVVVRADDGGPTTIDLPPIDLVSFKALLTAEGVPDGRADELARLARRTIYAFQRATPMSGQLDAPAWASELESRVARRAWLAGRWNERRSGDTDALVALFEVPYADAREELQRLASGADPLFVRVGESWAVTSLQDAWQFGHPHLEAPDLAAYEVLVQSVLGAVDPSLELPVAERWMAGIYGKARLHSADLRNGVADVLALMGAKGQDVSIGSGTIQSWLYRVLHRLFARLNDDPTGYLWASLTDVMPLLAESAPDVFLRALQVGLEGEQPLLRSMFADHEAQGSFSISSPHTGLLWALEGLAWSSEHFGQVVEQLARLAEIDPGGRLSNRPAASLTAIFRPWFPQTSVDAQRRLGALDLLRDRHSDIAWRLLLSMLPEHDAVGAHAQKPKFRDWPTEPEPITRGQLGEMYIAVAERAVEDAKAHPQRWVELIERFDELPAPVFPKAVAALQDIAVGTGEGRSELREFVWEPLRNLVLRHQRYSHTDWAMEAEQVEILDRLQRELAPKDPVELVRWLFEDTPDLSEEGGPDFDVGRYLEAVAERRREAVRQLYEAEGSAAVLRLASVAKLPWYVGYAVAEANVDDAGELLFENIDAANELLPAACAWTSQRSRALGWSWTEARVRELDGRPLAQARVLLESPDLEKAWDLARQTPEVEAAYWSAFSPYGRGQGFPLAERAAADLLAHDRPRAALMLMNLYAGPVNIDRAVVMEALERLVEMPQDHPDQFPIDSHELEHLLNYLRSGSVNEDRLMILEWRLRPALRFDANSPVLERRLARDPAFFIEVLSLCFKPRHSDPETDIPSHVATNAYRLLDDWSVVPGSEGPAKPVDAQMLNEWVQQALPLLRKADREEIGLEIIGRVLAKSPGDADDTWPTRPVRDLIEQLGRSELDSGFLIEILNSRGPSSRSLAEGGDQERALAENYHGLALRLSDQWPRTASIFRSLASEYEAEARRHDEEAQRFLEGLDP